MANRFKKLLGGGSGGGVTGLISASGGTSIADNKVIRGDGTTGIQGSGVTLSDADAITGVTALSVDNLTLDANTLSSTNSNGDINLDPNGTGNVVVTSGNLSISAGLLGLTGLTSSDSAIKDSTDRNSFLAVRAVRGDDGAAVGIVASSLQLGTNSSSSITDHKVLYDSARDELTFSSSQMIGWGPATTNPFADADTSFTRAAAGVVSVNAGRTTAQSGWIQTAGFKRKTADQTVTNSTTLVNDTHLTVSLAAGRSYGFRFVLFSTEVATSGLKIALAGTATHTNIIADVIYIPLSDVTATIMSRLTAVGTGYDTVSGFNDSRVVIEGTTTVNAAGTFLVQFAQSAETGAAETATLRRGSTLEVWDIA